jgi:hypothetical protein
MQAARNALGTRLAAANVSPLSTPQARAALVVRRTSVSSEDHDTSPLGSSIAILWGSPIAY